MHLRVKLLIVVLACGLLPSLLVNLLGYRAGARAVEESLRADAETVAAQLAHQLEAELRERSDAAESTRDGAAAESADAAQPNLPPTLTGGRAAHEERLRLNALVARLARGAGEEADKTVEPARQIVALAGDGQIVFHSNAAFHYRRVADVMPHFEPVGREMSTGRSGSQFFNAPPDGARWLAAYRPIAGTQFSLAVARNYTAATRDLRRAALAGVAASVLLASAAAALVLVLAGRASRAVEGVARAAARVAAGDLDQRVEVRTYDETRSLAENFNLMTDRLREQIRREAENRQFQAFFRLSAMLTHDLKNAITGLSMLVLNMERQFHREEFRADAVQSLKDATDKLRAIVSRLSEPVKTLSGEYRRSLQRTDLVALVGRVVSAHAAGQFHEIETDLPASLHATVDPERIEHVLENLVINALEAMGTSRGRLTVAAGREGESQVFISVADTGPGMSSEFIRTRLFRPFATTKNKGVGLGLYTCREVIEAHGGRIEVESEQGAGTRFRVVLPSDPVTHSRPDALKSG